MLSGRKNNLYEQYKWQHPVPLAQLVEHKSYTLSVASSILAWDTLMFPVILFI
jgi:hypothetical protein